MKRITMAAVALYALAGIAGAADDLATNFVTPPAEARPWVYWFWLNGNITREGITADLEAMQRVGIGGVLIMEVDQGAPVGPVAFMSDQWRELFRHMVSEAHRLGLEVNMNNDAGWNGSGGPWVPLDKAMQVVVSSETRRLGRRAGSTARCRSPRANAGFYRDIAVLAFPTPAGTRRIRHGRIQNLAAKAMSWARMHAGSLGAGRPADDVPAESVVARERIVDLTERMDATGTLVWDAPALADRGRRMDRDALRPHLHGRQEPPRPGHRRRTRSATS